MSSFLTAGLAQRILYAHIVTLPSTLFVASCERQISTRA
jgi:hypothetical protein